LEEVVGPEGRRGAVVDDPIAADENASDIEVVDGAPVEKLLGLGGVVE